MGQINYNDVAIQQSVGFTVAETKEAYKVESPNTKVTFMGNDDVAEYLGGYNYAIIVNKLLMLTENPSITGHQSDGKKWIRIGLFEGEEAITWASMLKCISPAITKRYLTQLRDDGLIEFKQIKGKGRSLYYCLNVQAIESLTKPVARVSKRQAVKVTNLSKERNLNTSDLPNSKVKSDLPNSEIKSHELVNQVSPIGELSLTNSKTSKSTNNTNINQESHTACATFSPLATVMAKALGDLDLSVKKNLNAVNKALTDLNNMYGHDVNEANVIRVSGLVFQKYGASPAKVYSQWSDLLANPERTEAELKAKELQKKNEIVASRIKEICKPPCPMGWEHISVKAKKKLLTDLAANIATNHQEDKLEDFTWWGGNEKPTIDQFSRAWVDHISKTNHKGETNHERNINNNDHFAIPSEGKLARATRTLVDM